MLAGSIGGPAGAWAGDVDGHAPVLDPVSGVEGTGSGEHGEVPDAGDEAGDGGEPGGVVVVVVGRHSGEVEVAEVVGGGVAVHVVSMTRTPHGVNT